MGGHTWGTMSTWFFIGGSLPALLRHCCLLAACNYVLAASQLQIGLTHSPISWLPYSLLLAVIQLDMAALQLAPAASQLASSLSYSLTWLPHSLLWGSVTQCPEYWLGWYSFATSQVLSHRPSSSPLNLSVAVATTTLVVPICIIISAVLPTARHLRLFTQLFLVRSLPGLPLSRALAAYHAAVSGSLIHSFVAGCHTACHSQVSLFRLPAARGGRMPPHSACWGLSS
jgi:hypothetical protein